MNALLVILLIAAAEYYGFQNGRPMCGGTGSFRFAGRYLFLQFFQPAGSE